MKAVTAFICDFCLRKRRFAHRGTAVRHEMRCFYNPIRKACATCAHYSYERPVYEHDTGYYDGGSYCEKDGANNDPEASTQTSQ